MESIQTQDHIQPRKGRGKLIWRFLKGSKALFILCMICSALISLGEMIVPQIIRITIDNIIGMTYGSLFDANQTMVNQIDEDTYQVQVVSWYDNENSYTSQMVRTIKYFAELK